MDWGVWLEFFTQFFGILFSFYENEVQNCSWSKNSSVKGTFIIYVTQKMTVTNSPTPSPSKALKYVQKYRIKWNRSVSQLVVSRCWQSSSLCPKIDNLSANSQEYQSVTLPWPKTASRLSKQTFSNTNFPKNFLQQPKGPQNLSSRDYFRRNAP